jgi:uncharacterized protein (TIGR03792 family)
MTVIELLKFHVLPEDREKFLKLDEQIWTPALAKYEAFLSKEIWLNPNLPEQIIIVVHWRSFQEWKAIPHEILEETEKTFSQAMGESHYQLIELQEHQGIKINY